MEKLPDEVIEQIKQAVSETIRMERENDRLRQDIQAQWEFYKRCELHRQTTEYLRRNWDQSMKLFEEMVKRCEEARKSGNT